MLPRERDLSPERQNLGLIRISELPENAAFPMIVDGHPPIRLQLAALRAAIPQRLHDQIAVDVKVLAGLARMGGLDRIHFDTQVGDREQFSMQISGVDGGAGMASHVGAARRTIEPTLDDIDMIGNPFDLEYRHKDHGDTYRSGGIPLVKEDLQEAVKQRSNNNPLDLQGWVDTLNKKSIKDLVSISTKHLTKIHGMDFVGLAVREVMAQFTTAFLIWADSIGVKHFVVTPQEIVSKELLTQGWYFFFDALEKYVLFRRRMHSRRLGEFGEHGPEYVRAGVMKTIAKVPALRHKFPIFVQVSPPEEVTE